MKTKILWGSLVLVLLAGLGTGAYWWSWRPQVVTLSDGTTVTLVGVDYGRKHTPPAVKAPAGKPTRRGGSFTTTNDTLVAWVRQTYDSQQYHSLQYFAYDEAGTACVEAVSSSGGNRQGSEVVGVRLEGFPRRQGKFYLRVLENSNGGQELSDQKFVIRNPVRESLAAWTPVPLPNTQDDGDVSVTLTKLTAGADMPFRRNGEEADDAMNQGVRAVFQVERNEHPVTNWEPVVVETWDATGNHVTARSTRTEWDGHNGVTTYQYGLWPEEPVWRVRCEFTQKSDFADTELWTVPGIPLLPGRQMDFYNNRRGSANTNAVFAEADLNGFRLKLFPAKVFTNLPGMMQTQGGLTVQTEPALPAGMRLTIVSLTDDLTNDVANYNSGTSGPGKTTTCFYRLQDLGDATNLSLTLALHKSRFVEFMVKPRKDGGN
jgi:hypothetical protein